MGDELERDAGAPILQTAADYYVLTGDRSAVPAMAALLARLPSAARGHALLEVPSSSDFVGLRAPGAFDVCWRFGRAAAEHPLSQRVRALRLPEGKVYVWMAGEAGLVRTLYAHFQEVRGLPAEQLFSLPLWSARPDCSAALDIAAE
jgi:NADPH-dependent ferric siderophore reductase